MTYTKTRPSLPGTPELPGEANAKAKLATIVAAYSLQCWANHRDTDLNCWDDLRSSMDAVSSDILELLDDYGISEADCCPRCNRRCASGSFLRDTPLSCEVRSSWYHRRLMIRQTILTEFRIWLTCGGPNCFIRGDFDRSSVDARSITVNFSWASQTRELPWSDDAEDALAWFCDSLVC